MRLQGKAVETNDSHLTLRRFYKLMAMAVPAGVILACAFLPLQELIRQAFVGIMLVWLYVGVMTGFSYFW